MYEFRFYDAIEIRMGSPYNLAKIDIKGDFLPDIDGFDFQDKAAISEDGHRLVLIEWKVSKNSPSFRVWDVDDRTRLVKKSKILEGCCEKLYLLGGNEIYVDIDLGAQKRSMVSPVFNYEQTFKKIYRRFQLSPAYHMTHIDNLEGIVSEGAIQCHKQMSNKDYQDISDDEVQNIRSKKRIKETGKLLHEYVPLFFGLKPPMVATRQHENENTIFLRVSLDIFERHPGCVIADGNAANAKTKFRPFQSIDDLEALNVRAIHSGKYKFDEEIYRQKQAELLVPGFVPLSEIFEIIVFSEEVKMRVSQILEKAGIKPAPGVYIRGNLWYYIPRKES